MAGRRQKQWDGAIKREPTKPARQIDVYQLKCQRLAEKLGFSDVEVWAVWEQLSLQIEFHQHQLTRPQAERFAFDLTEALLTVHDAIDIN